MWTMELWKKGKLLCQTYISYNGFALLSYKKIQKKHVLYKSHDFLCVPSSRSCRRLSFSVYYMSKLEAHQEVATVAVG